MAILQTYTKQPAEKRWFGIDFKPDLEAYSTTIVSHEGAVEDGCTIEDATLVDGVVLMLFSGGESGKTYKATVRVTLADGQLLESELRIKVKET